MGGTHCLPHKGSPFAWASATSRHTQAWMMCVQTPSPAVQAPTGDSLICCSAALRSSASAQTPCSAVFCSHPSRSMFGSGQTAPASAVIIAPPSGPTHDLRDNRAPSWVYVCYRQTRSTSLCRHLRHRPRPLPDGALVACPRPTHDTPTQNTHARCPPVFLISQVSGFSEYVFQPAVGVFPTVPGEMEKRSRG